MDELFNMFQSSDNEEKDIDDMSIDERLALHLQITENKEYISDDIINVLDINQDITDILIQIYYLI